MNKKCIFTQKQVRFLGQIVDHTGVRTNPDRYLSYCQVQDSNPCGRYSPTLSMTNELGKFSPNLANITKPLRGLLAKDSQ